MSRLYLFVDEGGCLAFNRKPNVSRYFTLTSIVMDSCQVGEALLELRRQLLWEDAPVGDEFHATNDKQVVRDRVFQVLSQFRMRIDATVIDKPKTQPKITRDENYFYKFAWYYHMRHVVPQLAKQTSELMVTGASFGTNKRKAILARAVGDVMWQVGQGVTYKLAYCPSAVDPCLQAADYCCWAIQRKWERGDERSCRLIADQVASEFDIFAIGRTEYY